MHKVTVLYNHPKDSGAFETYYAETHLPLVTKTTGITKAEYTRFLPNPDGSAPAFYRMAELYFTGPAEMQQVLASTDGKEMAADLQHFATGGVTIIFGTVDN